MGRWDHRAGASEARAAVEAATLDAVKRLGPGGVNKAAIARAFRDSGVARSTIYCWIGAYIATGEPGRVVVKQVREAAARQSKKREAGKSEPAEQEVTADEVRAALPVPLRVEEVVHGARNVADVVTSLNDCIVTARKVLIYAHKEDGSVRLPKLALVAADNLRRAAETLLKVHEAIRTVQETEHFIEELVAAVERIAAKHPAAAQEILAEVRVICARWSGA
jgi:hypothetical protein